MAEQARTAVPQFELRHRLDLALEYSEVTPAQMAAELDVSETTVRNYRSGRTTPNRSTLRIWALRCGVPFEWLATGELDLTGPETDPTQGNLSSGCIADVLTFRPRESRTPLLTAAAA